MPSATSTLRSLTSGAHKLVVLSNAGAPTAVAPSATEDGTSTDGSSRLRADSKSFLLSRLVSYLISSGLSLHISATLTANMLISAKI